MDAQRELFDTGDEIEIVPTATWLQLPETARAAVLDLFAALSIKHLAAHRQKGRER